MEESSHAEFDKIADTPDDDRDRSAQISPGRCACLYCYSIVRMSENPVTSKISMMISFAFFTFILPC